MICPLEFQGVQGVGTVNRTIPHCYVQESLNGIDWNILEKTKLCELMEMMNEICLNSLLYVLVRLGPRGIV